MPSKPSTPTSFKPRPLAVAIALAIAPGASVFAQQATAPATSSGTLDTVTVTAERREENAKDVPMSISTISGEKLDVLNSEGQDIRMLSGRVPSLNIESSFGRAFPRFYIRGYGNTDFHLNASQPVSLVYDDIVQENPILKGFPIFDVDQIEVLAGPQGTLFGRNTPAGVVKVDSAKPTTDRIEGYINAGWARFNTQNYEGAINVPISSMLAVRVSVQSQHRNDYVANEGPNPPSNLEGYDDNASRVQLLFKPNADFSALVGVHERTLNGSARLFRANIIKPGTNDFVDNFNPRQVTFDGANAQKLESNGANVRLRWDLGPIALNSISGYEHVSSFSRGDIDGGVGPGTFPPTGLGAILFSDETSDALQGHEQLSQEFRVESTGSGPLRYQGGLYFFHENYGIDSLTYDTIGHTAPSSVKTFQTNNAWAAFASVNYRVIDPLDVRAGIRYTQDRKFLNTTADTSIDTRGGTSGGTHDSKISWDVSATYKVTPDLNVYTRVANSFRGSSIFPAGPFGPQTSAGPETNTSYEIGSKADLFDKRARASLTLFDYLVDNQQLSAVGGQFNSTALLSAKHAVGRGVEASLDAYITPSLLVTLNGSYNFTKIKDGTLVVAPCAFCTVTNTPGVGGVHIDGNPLPQAPKVIGNFTARYSYPILSGEAFVYTDWTYRSKVNFFLYQSPEFTGKSMVIGGLRAGYDWNNGRYEVAAFGRNITNTVRITGGIDFNNLTGFINEPRIWGAQFKATF
jgi:iron complex outermembrane recepter protein